MATLTQITQYHIHILSEQIRYIKTEAFKTTKATKPVYLHEDGRIKVWPDYKYPEDYKAGFKYTQMPYDKTVSCIGLNHPSWSKYLELKAEVSLLLTARRILKISSGSRPTKSDLRKAIRGGKLGQHSPKRDQNLLIFKAYGALTTLAQSPEADAWVAERAARLAAKEKENA